MSIVTLAREIATKAHEGVVRKWVTSDAHPNGVPYITHPTRIAERVQRLRSATDVMVAAAWLHDVVEDTKLPHEQIIDACGVQTYYLVLELTNPSKQLLKANRQLKKEVDRYHIERVSSEAKLIKLIDRTDNLCESLTAPESFRKKYIPESDALVLILKDPPMFGESQARVADRLDLLFEFDSALKTVKMITPE